MDTRTQQENLLRWYLLGSISPEEEGQVEELLRDGEMGVELQLAEEDLIDDYARGSISAGDRELFELNFLTTAERREKLLIAQSAVKYSALRRAARDISDRETIKASERLVAVSERQGDEAGVIGQVHSWWRSWMYPAWRIPVYAALVIGLGLAVWQIWPRGSDVSMAMEVMNEAYSRQRPLEARITEFRHAPYPRTLGSEPDKNDPVALDRAERILLDEVSQRPGPAAEHALGRLYLSQKKFEQAEGLLRKALQTRSDDARIHSDLGALLFEKWEQTRGGSERSYELQRQSLEHLTTALRLEDRLLEARFNRALLYQRMGQPQLAREEWRNYLTHDPTSPWAEEARVHLNSLK